MTTGPLTPEEKADIGSRLGHSHTAAAAEMEANSRREAYGSVLVKVGIIFSGISLFKLIAGLIGIPLPKITQLVVALYTSIFHVPIETIAKPFHLSPPEALMDVISIYVLAGAILSRPLQAVLRLASNADSPATFYYHVVKRFGEQVDLFMYNRFPQTVGRYVVIILSVLLMPLTLYVFWKYPFTKTAGGVIGVYQSGDRKIRDGMTLDMPHYDGHLILTLQLTGSLSVCALLLIMSFLFAA